MQQLACFYILNNYLHYMTIMIALTIVICHDSRIMMSQNLTIAHLYTILPPKKSTETSYLIICKKYNYSYF